MYSFVSFEFLLNVILGCASIQTWSTGN